MRKKTPPKVSSEYSTIEGRLVRVSGQGTFVDESSHHSDDYYFLGIKTLNGDRLMVYVTTKILGIYGDMNTSRIYYFNVSKKRYIKTLCANPEKYLGKWFQVTGHLETINLSEQKYRMNQIQQIIIFMEDPPSAKQKIPDESKQTEEKKTD
jgi:hypothetical protein